MTVTTQPFLATEAGMPLLLNRLGIAEEHRRFWQKQLSEIMQRTDAEAKDRERSSLQKNLLESAKARARDAAQANQRRGGLQNA